MALREDGGASGGFASLMSRKSYIMKDLFRILYGISPVHAVLLSALLTGSLVTMVVLLQIPNPNMILVAGLVTASAMFGYCGGATSGMIMLIYSLYFFSDEHSFMTFSELNAEKVLVVLVGILITMFIVCKLRAMEARVYARYRNLQEALKAENLVLKEMSHTDALTGVMNRMALHRDLENFRHEDITVIMLDLDRFKEVNDKFGHENGDRVLRRTGELLREVFGKEHSYRYGGDEFIIILPGAAPDEVTAKLDRIMATRPGLESDSSPTRVGFSVGYVSVGRDSCESVRDLLALADRKMYDAKSGGRNRVVG